MIKPIRPCEVEDARDQLIPEKVIEVFNELIARNFDGKQSTIFEYLITEKINQTDYKSENHWSDVKSVYRRAGWLVEFIKPDLGVRSGAKFIFKRKTN